MTPEQETKLREMFLTGTRELIQDGLESVLDTSDPTTKEAKDCIVNLQAEDTAQGIIARLKILFPGKIKFKG